MSQIDDHGARIEKLLDDVRAAAGPAAWPRVESLVTALVDLYGAGLERMLARARETARDPKELDARLASDELIGSLLALHDLHPIAIEDRIDGALERLQTEIPDSTGLALVGIEDGFVTLRVAPESSAAHAGSAPALAVVARAIEHAAPEVTGVRVEGAEPAAPKQRGLIPASDLVRGARP